MVDPLREGDAKIRPMSSSKAKQFIKKHHYTGTCHNGPKCWALFIDDKLVGVTAFANPIAESVRRQIFGDSFRGTVFGLHRVVTLDSCPKNTESWFVRKALDCLKADSPQYWAVISYADSTRGHTGIIYQALNAIYFGMTDGMTYYIDQDGSLRPPRDGNSSISKSEARGRGWEISKRGGKHSYLFLLPKNDRHRKKLEELLKVDPKPYPSNDTDRIEDSVEKERPWASSSAAEVDW